MIFEIHAEKMNELGVDTAIFTYDNTSNILKNSDGEVFQYPDITKHNKTPSIPFDKNSPLKKSKSINLLKIQMGLSCNYSCDYCSQKFVERAQETSKKDIDAFMEKLNVLSFDEERGLQVEFWGGEPFVYWKTMKPLAEAMFDKFSSWKVKPIFSVITNGSILTDEMIDWLMQYNFRISISHDGPGQSVRGIDPFDDPEQKERLLGLYRMMTNLKKGFSFNAMLNSKNRSRLAIYEWFVELTGDENVKIGEGSIVDAYDEDGISNSLTTKKDHFEFRKQAFGELYQTDANIGFVGVLQKIGGFVQDVLSHTNSKYLGQKCGMDDIHTLAIDLRGNVMTCQNVSSLETAPNDESHHGGNLDDYDNVSLKSSTHWSNRKECGSCPVLHLCKGSCMFLDKKYWDISCANAYSDNVVFFAAAIQNMTGYIPTLIKQDDLPLDRQDIFGTTFEHKEDIRKKLSSIKVVSEISSNIDEVEVYGKSYIKSI